MGNGADSSKARSRSLDSPNKKPRTLSSEYRSPKAERNAKAFIASKSLKVSDELNHVSNPLMPKGLPNLNNTSSQPTTPSTGDHKNSGNPEDGGRVKMAVWEQKMRVDLADIQKK